MLLPCSLPPEGCSLLSSNSSSMSSSPES
uniref:Uncharacterized protein n=1 Tax=Arundo donax TaxID=35708 RepID=A0A0A9FY55_ARUDO